ILRENVGDYTAAGRSLAEIEADLERTRKAQLAIRHLPTLNVTTISLPLSNKLGRTIGALSLSAISPRMSGEHLLTAVEHLREAGRVIARDVELDEHVLSQLIPT